MTRTSRAVVFLGGGKWEIRELAVPDHPPEGGAILRVEAVGMCHSDIDNLHGIVHTPWGGEFPTIPGHEVVGRIEQLGAGAADALGAAEGDRVAVRSGRMARGQQDADLRSRLLRRRGIRSVWGLRRLHGAPSGISVVRLPGDRSRRDHHLGAPVDRGRMGRAGHRRVTPSPSWARATSGWRPS